MKLVLDSKVKNIYFVLVAIGLLTFALELFTNPVRAWHGYILNYYFFVCLGLGGCFFAATQHLTNAGWSATVRRIPEAFYSWFPFAVVLFIPILIWGKSVYLWTNPVAVAQDHLLAMKTAYLNIPSFLIRTIAFFLMWSLIGGRLVTQSLKQDAVGGTELTKQNIKYSAIFIPFFAILFSLFSFDLLMSLDPHWYSTMFGVNCFANLFLTTIAMAIVFIVHLKRKGYFGESLNENHIQNLGLLLFAFVIFYAYIVFCQFMLIWYGNLPEETAYYLKRWENGWSLVSYLIMVFKFLVPFLLLLPREAKRNQDRLVKISYLVLAASWLDTYWMVMPNYSKGPVLPLVEIGIFLGFLGAFALSVTRFLSKNAIQPQKDPRIEEALHLHQ